MLISLRNQMLISKEVINCFETGRAGKTYPPTHLNWCRLEGKSLQPVVAGMPGEIDQDIDLIAPYLLGKFMIRNA